MEQQGIFITFRNLDKTGISKKILVQKASFDKLLDSKLDFIYCKDNFLYYNETKLFKINRKLMSKVYRFVINKIREKKYNFIYLRYEFYSNYFFIKMMKLASRYVGKIVLEIPTFPYDGEVILSIRKLSLIKKIYAFYNFYIEKLYRKQLRKYVNRIVTYSTDDIIYGIKTIKITNGIDLNSVKMICRKPDNSESINLIGVAKLTTYHGYDRLIMGIYNYIQSIPHSKIHLLIVGGSDDETFSSLVQMVNNLHLQDYVTFAGNVPYDELELYFKNVNIGIGSLARHRSGVYTMASLKNREYAARGIPFIYSENDTSFDNQPFVLKVKADESPIDINQIITFAQKVRNISPESIRKTVENLDWLCQIKEVVKYINS